MFTHDFGFVHELLSHNVEAAWTQQRSSVVFYCSEPLIKMLTAVRSLKRYIFQSDFVPNFLRHQFPDLPDMLRGLMLTSNFFVERKLRILCEQKNDM